MELDIAELHNSEGGVLLTQEDKERLSNLESNKNKIERTRGSLEIKKQSHLAWMSKWQHKVLSILCEREKDA